MVPRVLNKVGQDVCCRNLIIISLRSGFLNILCNMVTPVLKDVEPDQLGGIRKRCLHINSIYFKSRHAHDIIKSNAQTY